MRRRTYEKRRGRRAKGRLHAATAGSVPIASLAGRITTRAGLCLLFGVGHGNGGGLFALDGEHVEEFRQIAAQVLEYFVR